MDNKTPSFVDFYARKNILEDESNYWNLLPPVEHSFYQFDEEYGAKSSAWNNFPTAKNPRSKYKHASLGIMISRDQMIWNRQTYSTLDYLGDLGGLYQALEFIAGWIVAPLTSYALNQTLMTSIYRYKPRESELTA